MRELIIKVNGMMCEGCENRIVNAVEAIKGVESVIANHDEGFVIVNADEKVEMKAVQDKINDIGFEVVKDNE